MAILEPRSAAKCKGVSPRRLSRSTSSCFLSSSNLEIISPCPPRQAQCSPVLPALSGTLTGILFARHSSRSSKFPLLQASWKALPEPPILDKDQDFLFKLHIKPHAYASIVLI